MFHNTNHYNLQAIIAVGFKVNNDRAVQFRKWAGQIVKDYTIQGWTMDVERLKKGTLFTDAYFDRQLENIREILKCVARALLPMEIMEGNTLHYEMMTYTIVG